jgi:hypothetical protein
MKSLRRFPVAAALLRKLVLLQLCLLAGVAAAQSPEIEAEAKKLFTTLFIKCGEDYFSKRTFKYKSGTAYILSQYKELAPRVKSNPLSKTDPLNGVEWKGVIRFTASVGRQFPHGEELIRRGVSPKKNGHVE